MFERLVFGRGSQTLILRCTRHVAEPEFFTELSEEINKLSSEGYDLLIEGIGPTHTLLPNASRNEKRIANVLNTLFDLVHKSHEIVQGMVSQKRAVHYPEHAIKADLPFAECVRFLHEHDVRIPVWFPFIIKTNAGKSCLEDVVALVAKNKGLVYDNMSFPFFCVHPVSILIGLGLRSYTSHGRLLHTHREKVAVSKIEEHARSKPRVKILVHFGQGHKNAITKLLQVAGWRMEGSGI